MRPEHKKTITLGVIILLITILGIFVRGYSFGVGDQVLYLPLLAKLANQSLYPGDDLFPALFSNRAPIYDLLAGWQKWQPEGLFLPYLIAYLLSNFLFCLGIYQLAKTLFKNDGVAITSLFLTLLPYPVAGSAITTVETGFVLRLPAHALVLLALAASFKKNWWQVLIFLGLAVMVHPLTAVVSALVLIPLMIWSTRPTPKLIASGTLMSLVIFPVLLDRFTWIKQMLWPVISENWWIEIIRLRNPYVFPTDWSGKSWLLLIVVLLPLLYGVFKDKLSSTLRLWMGRIMAIVVFLTIVQTVFSALIPVSLIVILQLGRVWFIPVVISQICLAFYIVRGLARLNFSIYRWAFIILLMVVVAIIIRKDNFLISQNPDWVAAQIWAKTHTSPNCTFLTNFYSQGFRVYSQRPIVGEYKDGTLSFYAKDLARRWDEKRYRLQVENGGELVKPLAEIYNKYPFSLIVVNRGGATAGTKVYENDKFTVYKYIQSEDDCLITL